MAARVELHVSGFGPFHGVPVNHTQSLVELLPSALSSAPLPPLARLASTCVLAVDAAATTAAMRDWPPAPAPGARRLLLLLGVHKTSTEFCVERCAFNEAAFRCPDQAGYQAPPGTRVCESRPTGACLRTRLDVEGLAARIRSRGCPARVSDDAGRFLCNYAYYLALRSGEEREAWTDALFLHCPPPEAIGLERQLSAVVALLSDLVDSAPLQRTPSAPSASSSLLSTPH